MKGVGEVAVLGASHLGLAAPMTEKDMFQQTTWPLKIRIRKRVHWSGNEPLVLG